MKKNESEYWSGTYLSEIQDSLQTDKYLWLTFALYNSGLAKLSQVCELWILNETDKKNMESFDEKTSRFNESNEIERSRQSYMLLTIIYFTRDRRRIYDVNVKNWKGKQKILELKSYTYLTYISW